MKKQIKENMLYWLAALIIVCFFVLLGFLVFNAIPVQNISTLNLVIGALIAAFGAVINYFFGSSAGSARKTDLMSKKDPNETN